MKELKGLTVFFVIALFLLVVAKLAVGQLVLLMERAGALSAVFISNWTWPDLSCFVILMWFS